MNYNLNDTEIIATNFKRRLSGVSSSIIQLTPKLQQLGVKIKVLGFGLPKHLPFVSFLALFSLWKAPKGRPFYILHVRRHTEMIFGIILRDILRAKIKIIFTAAAQRKQQKFSYYLMSKMDRLIAANQQISAYLKSPNVVIMHGIDTERFKPGPSPLKISFATKYIIGCCGRIRFSKGTDIFIDSMIELLPRFKDWIAVFSGRITPENRSYATKIFNKINKNGLGDRILYLGEFSNHGGDNDINFLYKKLNLYVTPSRNEGFGLTALEAMSSAVPCIAGQTGSYAEVIGETYGKIVKDFNAKNLAIAIEPFFQNPKSLPSMGQLARQHIIDNYSLKHEATKLLEVYEDLFKQAT